MKSVETTTYGYRSNSDSFISGRARGGRTVEAAPARRRCRTSRAAPAATARPGRASRARPAGCASPWASSSVAIRPASIGLADADVVGDQQPDGVLAQRQQQRDELVGARLDGEAGRASGTGRRTSGTRCAARCAAGRRSPRRRGRRRSGGGKVASVDGLECREDGGDVVVAAAERAQHEQVAVALGQHHPLPAAGADQRSGGVRDVMRVSPCPVIRGTGRVSEHRRVAARRRTSSRRRSGPGPRSSPRRRADPPRRRPARAWRGLSWTGPSTNTATGPVGRS